MCDSSVLYRVMLQGLSSFLFVFPCFVFFLFYVCALGLCVALHGLIRVLCAVFV